MGKERTQRDHWTKMLLRIGRRITPIARLREIYRHLRWRYGPPKKVRIRCGCVVLIDKPEEFIQKALMDHGVFEPSVVAVLRTFLRSGDVFFDVGANIGHHSLVAASCGAEVHAFEPVPRLAKTLRKHVAINDLESIIRVNELALGRSAGSGTLFVAARVDDGSHSLIPGVPASSIRRIDVRIGTIDGYCDRTRCRPPDLIKVDVEGYEAPVIDGAARLMSRATQPSWVFETGDRLAEQIGESVTSVIDRFVGYSYRIFKIADDSVPLTEIRASDIGGELGNYLAVPSGSRRLSRILGLTCP